MLLSLGCIANLVDYGNFVFFSLFSDFLLLIHIQYYINKLILLTLLILNVFYTSFNLFHLIVKQILLLYTILFILLM